MIVFFALAVFLIATAMFTVTAKSPVHAVVGLLANFVALAMMYLTLSAEFLAVIQLVVYSGAILILFLFVIAMLSSGVGPFREGPNRMPGAFVPSLLLVGAAFGLLVYGMSRYPLGALTPHGVTSTLGEVGKANVFGSVGDFGVALFTTHLLPFEVTAFILMVAVVGVVMLAGDVASHVTRAAHVKKAKRKREPIAKAKSASRGSGTG